MTTQRKVVRGKFEAIQGALHERGLRRWAAAEASSIGRGGTKLLAGITGLSTRTIQRGKKEIQAPASELAMEPGRSRRAGGGRKRLAQNKPELTSALEQLVSPSTRGHPESALKWTSKSTEKLAAQLRAAGYQISARSVSALLKQMGYSLQSMRKTMEGGKHVDRHAQFEHIDETVRAFQARGEPVISVDAKKKELVGTFTNKGREWQPKGKPEQANVYDFVDEALGKVTPYGVYDLSANEGWVSVGVDHDTAEFAVQSIRTWWQQMGRSLYRNAKRICITADGGGSNGSRVRLWKAALAQWAKETGLEVHVCHFPPGTSKWNKIEHRLFSYLSINWRGRPLESRQIIVSLIAQTTTKAGLKVSASLDEGIYPLGKKVTDEQMASLNLTRHSFHGEWNYSLSPK